MGPINCAPNPEVPKPRMVAYTCSVRTSPSTCDQSSLPRKINPCVSHVSDATVQQQLLTYLHTGIPSDLNVLHSNRNLRR